MTSFASPRERRLWLWVLVVVVAIYSTLGLGPTVAIELRNRDLLDSTFVLGLIAAMGAVVSLSLKTRPRGVEIGVVLGITAVYLLVALRMALPEERTHLFEYGVLSLFIYEALLERAGHGRRVRAPAVIAIFAASLAGVFDEVIQAVLPSRVFDPLDIGFNILAAAMAVVASVVLRRVRRRSDGPRTPARHEVRFRDRTRRDR